MKRIVAIALIAAAVLLPAYSGEQPLMDRNTIVYGAYEGVFGDGPSQSFGVGVQYRTHLFSLPLFFYADFAGAYPVARTGLSTGGESGPAITVLASTGLGYRAMLPHGFSFSVGAGLSGFFLFGIGSGSSQMDMGMGIEGLAEVQYAFFDNLGIALQLNPQLDFFYGGNDPAGRYSGSMRFRMEAKAGVSLQWGDEI